MTSPRFTARHAALGLAAVSLGACSAGQSQLPDAPAPHVLALSTYEASVGTTIRVFGTQFSDGRYGRMKLVFDGQFTATSGRVEQVHQVLDARYVDGGTLVWNSFGPYTNPMSGRGDAPGTFHGTIAAQLVQDNGVTVNDSHPLMATFTVLPSILVEDFQPVGAGCAGPAVRGIGGFVYHLGLRAIGFNPVSFTYTVAAPAINAPVVSMRALATGNGASFDGVTLPDVPEKTLAYDAVIAVQAMDDHGVTHATAFSIGVHRALEVAYRPNMEIAETFAPEPVSGCQPGGDNGRQLAYNETTTDTRARGVSQRFDSSWTNSHTDTTGRSISTSMNTSHGVTITTTNGQSFAWHQDSMHSTSNTIHDNFNAGGSLFGLVDVGAAGGFDHNSSNGQSQGVAGTYNSGTSNGTSDSVDYGHAETTTESASDSVAETTAQGESHDSSLTQSISQLRGFSGTLIANRYGVFYRQTQRVLRHASVVAFNGCGEALKVADLDMNDWVWAADLAQGSTCTPLPASTLPPAQCIVGPCDSQ